ncbi:MAG: hypothetical protein H6907_16875 [Hyphomicrobiales bacterium]|nr:hypothetical protein [Hyphomicrobiales bacterium]
MAAWADGARAPTAEEMQHQRAKREREAAAARAASRLGYPTVDYEPEFNRHVDYYALGLQMRRLGALIQQMADPAGTGILPPAGTPMVPGGGQGVAAVYGPDGPTEKSVRLILEYRLMVVGNPHLRVGQVRESGDAVTAQVVTADGSLVEEYSIDRKTGAWTPVR